MISFVCSGLIWRYRSCFGVILFVVIFMCVIPVVLYTISMAIYVRGTYRQNTTILLDNYCRFTTTCFGPIPGPSSGCITT